MNKTTVYLPAALDLRLEAEAKAEGVSKAELIRRGITKLLDESDRPRRAKPLPVFRGVGDRTLDDRDRELTDEIAERAARR
ncbi:MAG: ribbon-helix-helix protein, CopG family [Mycolicibacterium sp.]|uniref:ribbon-helix-helix domain-containing protein n=1 Tax=Mycolicibacterium insubricum TaxID=444597 RepID=UPI0009F6CAA5|nr:CopG family transcriptional regulator [Mycolicibacterium insubricum]MCB9440695.1 ribbon-helix-helix protein, CopG family [Mycolicibacterium sp.]MCV7083401.1 ribbon-helix-helix protein, CopG family [Mycolicibacterium insubricum]